MNKTMSREWTTALLNAMDADLLTARNVAEMALAWLDEADVEEMCRENDLEFILGMTLVDDDEPEDEDIFDFENDDYDPLRDCQ